MQLYNVFRFLKLCNLMHGKLLHWDRNLHWSFIRQIISYTTMHITMPTSSNVYRIAKEVVINNHK